MTPPLQRSLVSDKVFQLLCETILSARYAPGERLPTQRALAAELGVNMASIREAVKRLEQLRLVESRQGEGMRVRDWRAHGGLDVIAHVLFQAGGLDPGTLRSLLEARTLMLQESARLAAVRRSTAQAERLTAIAEQIAGAQDDAAAQALDFAFFAEVIEAADNVVFLLIMNSIRELYFDHAESFSALAADRTRLAPLYARAARAIAAGHDTAAARAARELAELQAEALRP